jgi:7,8-dihydroneopterin aldolase/epimerase/oxygenase
MNNKSGTGQILASATLKLRHVFVRDLEVMAHLGIYEHERLQPQKIIVNIDLSVKEGESQIGDEISHVVSYEGHINLVETLCEKIASACLRDRRVAAVRVRVEKPDIIPNAKSVGVEIERVAFA